MAVRVLQTVAVSAQAATPVTSLAWIPLDINVQNFNVKYAVNFTGSGQVNYRVQGTMDNILDSSVSAYAFNVLASGATQDDGVYIQPIAAIRLQVVSASASSNGSFRVIQSGI